MRRSSREVAVRAIIFGTLGFRASLEVTAHQRSESLCSQLVPWLEQLNLGARINDFHREILVTPFQKLTHEFQTEAYWRGEAASFLGWAIQLIDKPHPTESVDPGVLVQRLRILQPNTGDLISRCSLRSEVEVDDYCTFCLTVRHKFQVSGLDEDGQAVLKRIHESRLADLGLSEALHRRKEIETEAAQLASAVPRVKGLYVVRALAAEWLLGQDE
jgi:Domain of unknown function (DUF4272)